jgi:hypothetical protein
LWKGEDPIGDISLRRRKKLRRLSRDFIVDSGSTQTSRSMNCSGGACRLAWRTRGGHGAPPPNTREACRYHAPTDASATPPDLRRAEVLPSVFPSAYANLRVDRSWPKLEHNKNNSRVVFLLFGLALHFWAAARERATDCGLFTNRFDVRHRICIMVLQSDALR